MIPPDFDKQTGTYISRRQAFRRVGIGGLAALAVLTGNFHPQVAQAAAVEADSTTTRQQPKFRSPEISNLGPSQLLVDSLVQGAPNKIFWENMPMHSIIKVTPENPIVPETPIGTEGNKFQSSIIRLSTIQEGPLVFISTRMEVDGEGVGISHANQQTENGILTYLELRKGRELYAIVNEGYDRTKKPYAEELIDVYPDDGRKEVVFGMMLADGGKTFGAFGIDGTLKKVIDLPRPTAEIGAQSFLVTYKWGNTPEARVTGCAISVPE